jgi:tetratricopeptide (TPR) repeat protein
VAWEYEFVTDQRSMAGHKVVMGLLLAALWGCPGGEKLPTDPIGRAARQSKGLSDEAAAERLEDAREAVAAGDFNAAIDLLQPVVSRSTAEVEAYALYGRSLLEVGRTSSAIWPLLRTVDGVDPDSEGALDIAQALLRGGDPEAALVLLNGWIEESPNSADLYRLRVQCHRRRLDYEAALADLDVLIDLTPDDLMARELRVAQLEEVDEIEEARAETAALYDRAVEIGSIPALRARFCSARGHFEERHGDLDRARKHFDDCLALYPVEPEVVVGRSYFLAARGEVDDAIQSLEAAIEGGGHLRQRLHIALGDQLVAAGRRSEAVAVFEAAAERLGSPQPLIELADHQMAWGEVEAASQSVTKAIELRVGASLDDPAFSWGTLEAGLRFAFADILIRTRQLDRVERIIASLEEEEGEAVYPMLLKARVALERREPRVALDLFQESFKTWPSNVGARYLAGRAAMELGDFDLGLSLYQDAFRADTNESDAGLVLARLQLAQGLAIAAGQTLSTLLGNATAEQPEATRLFANVATNLAAYDTAKAAREGLATLSGWADKALYDQAFETLGLEGVEAAIAVLVEGGCLEKPTHHDSLGLWYRLQHTHFEDEGRAARAKIFALAENAPGDASLALAEASVHRLDGNLEAALVAARRAVEADPRMADAANLLGTLLIELERWEEAEETFAELIAIEPEGLTGRIGRAEAVRRAGRLDEAEPLYYEALVTHPWSGRAARALARMAFERGDLSDESVVWARWAARFNEGEEVPETATLLAEMRLGRAEFEEARIALLVAREAKGGDDPRGAYLMARALVGLKREEEARLSLSQALEGEDFAEREEALKLARQLDAGIRAGGEEE